LSSAHWQQLQQWRHAGRRQAPRQQRRQALQLRSRPVRHCRTQAAPLLVLLLLLLLAPPAGPAVAAGCPT
jgi:hypothetical protein